MKKSAEDKNIFNMRTINDNHTMYRSWGMEHDKQFFVNLDHFLPFYPTDNPEN